MPATMHADIPAIEIALGETLREASQAVDDWAHFRLRVAIARTFLSALQDLQTRLSVSHNLRMTARERVKQLIKAFPKVYPNAHTELNFKDPLQLLVATILSAQCTDKRVNMVTPALFKKYRTA